jgi:hypothetical protein
MLIYTFVIRPGIETPSLARPKLMSSFRFLLRSGGSRSAPTATLLLLAFVSHSQQVALVLTGVNVSERIYSLSISAWTLMWSQDWPFRSFLLWCG